MSHSHGLRSIYNENTGNKYLMYYKDDINYTCVLHFCTVSARLLNERRDVNTHQVEELSWALESVRY